MRRYPPVLASLVRSHSKPFLSFRPAIFSNPELGLLQGPGRQRDRDSRALGDVGRSPHVSRSVRTRPISRIGYSAWRAGSRAHRPSSPSSRHRPLVRSSCRSRPGFRFYAGTNKEHTRGLFLDAASAVFLARAPDGTGDHFFKAPLGFELGGGVRFAGVNKSRFEVGLNYTILRAVWGFGYEHTTAL